MHKSNKRSPLGSRCGAMLAMIVVVIIILFVGAAFAIDIAYMHSTRAELRTATDAAARAGTEALGRLQDTNLAVAAAIEAASRNQVAGEPLVLTAADVQFGTAQRTGSGRFEFVPGGNIPDAIRVVGRRTDDSASGSVPLFFGPLLGVTDFQPVQFATASATTRDIALVLDISGSMNRSSGSGTRLTALISAVHVFIDEINSSSPNSQMSLTTYSSTAQQEIELTPDLESIRRFVDGLTADGRTAIGLGLLVGSDSLVEDDLVRQFSSKTVVVMTDGNHNLDVNPRTTVLTAADRGQTVHTITFSSGANQNLMREVAELGGGKHVHADSDQELRDAFREIARTIAVVLID